MQSKYKLLLHIVAVSLIAIVSLYQLSFDNIFRVSNIVINEGLNTNYLLLLIIPTIQIGMILLILKKRKVIFSLLGLLFILPFIFTEAKELNDHYRLVKKFEEYAKGINVESYNAEINRSNTGLPISDLENSIRLAGDYLINSIRDDGRFSYKRNLNPKYDNSDNEYNILRHAGAIYSAANYLSEYKNVEHLNKLLSAGKWLKSTIIGIPEGNKIKAVWSPAENENTSFDQAKLGGTALTLIALLELEKLAAGFTESSFIKSLGGFILFMQKDNGEFYTRYNRQYGGRLDKNKSLFYPGQAILALYYLYGYTGDRLWLEYAIKGLNYLVESRKETDEYPPDHWILIATGRMYEDLKDIHHTNFIDIDATKQHTDKVCSTFTDFYKCEDSDSYGCLSNDGRTCYTASTLEGLISVTKTMPLGKKRNEIKSIIQTGIEFLVNSQIKSGMLIGAIPKMYRPWTLEYIDLMEKAGEVRIDYVQHALSTLLLYKDLIKKDIYLTPAG